MQVFSKIIGSGRPLLILHGLLGMSDNWLTIGKALAKEGFAVHLLDLRNHGRSPHFPTHTYLDMCDDIENYIEKANFSQVSIIGHSMGGKVAMFLGLKRPQNIDKLIIVDIAPSPYNWHTFQYHATILRTLIDLDLSLYQNKRTIIEELGRKFQDQALAMFLGKNIRKEENNSFTWKLNLQVLLDALPVINDGLEELDEYSPSPVETLFIKGGLSDYIREEHEADRLKYYPNSEIIMIENAGHWVHAEQPEAFYRNVVNFLEKKENM